MMVANRVIALIWYQVAGDLALYLVKRVVVWDIGGVGGWWVGGCFCVLVLWKSVVAGSVVAVLVCSFTACEQQELGLMFF